jgi:beta-lactamase class A
VSAAGWPLLAVARDAVDRSSLRERLATLETGSGGRLGVAVIDASGATLLAQRAGERFPMCSTFKLPLTGAVLRRVDTGRESLARRIRYGRADLLPYAPITRAHLAQGSMTVGALCAAAIEYSDNTAANLLLASVGGPAAVTRFVRTLGDPSTRLDRYEPQLNEGPPGDPRDTTTPLAVVRDARALVLGDALSPHSRDLLVSWLVRARTGFARLRAGFPRGWRAGDKTGTCDNHSANDIAVVWPPNGSPFLVAAYLTGATIGSAQCDHLLASVARIVTAARSA